MNPNQWRRTPVGRYLRHLPRIKHVRGTWLHRRLGDRLFARELWQPERTRFAAGCAVGTFFSMMPLPVQMLAAALICFLTRVNIPAAILVTWVSNPLTTPFILLGQYHLGNFLLGRQGHAAEFPGLVATLTAVPIPLILGALVSGVVLSLVAYPLALVGWDRVTAKFLKRNREKSDVRAD